MVLLLARAAGGTIPLCVSLVKYNAPSGPLATPDPLSSFQAVNFPLMRMMPANNRKRQNSTLADGLL
jgi:hypothetical protein